MLDKLRMVAFFGPDGAGKSTQADLMRNSLKGKGFRTKKAWVRSTHTLAYILWRLLYSLNLCEDRGKLGMRVSRRLVVSYLNESSYGVVSPITMCPPVLRGKFSKLLWSIIELIGVVPVIMLQVYIPLLLGSTIVAERYVVDSVVSIAYFLNDERFDRSWQAGFLLSFVPRGTLFVFVDADYPTIVSRRGKLAGPVQYTEFHRKMFRLLAARMGAVYVNCSADSVEKVHERILSRVQSDFLN